MKDDNKDTESVLYEINEKVDQLLEDDPLAKLEPRIDPNPSSKRMKLLTFIKENGPVTAKQCKQIAGESTTRALTTLYYNFAVNRDEENNKYKYTISTLGERIVDSGQQPLSNEHADTNPWDDTCLNRGEFLLLEYLNECDGHPQPSEIKEDFAEQSGLSENSIHPYLSNLMSDGLVGRTSKPHMYFLTQDGKEILD